MKCSVCGSDNLEGTAYCEDCGSRLVMTPSTPVMATPTPVAPAPVAPAPVPVAPAPVPVAPAPMPVAPAPVPVAPAPMPVAPAPVPVAPAPAPVAPAPVPVAPAPVPAAPVPTPVAEPAPYAAPASVEMPAVAIVCSACGASNSAGSLFCEDCGARLQDEAAAPAAPAPVSVSAAAPAPVSGNVAAPAPVVVARPRLVVNGSAKEYELDREVMLLGRNSPADGIFPEIDLTEVDTGSYISRRHGRLTRKNAAFVYEDMGSSNGSFLNGNKLVAKVQVELHDGDTLRLGRTEMCFRI